MIDRTRLLTREELARKLGKSVKTLDRWCRDGLYGVRLRKHYIGDLVFFDPQDVDAWQCAVDAARRPPEVPVKRTRRRGKDSAAVDDYLRAQGML